MSALPSPEVPVAGNQVQHVEELKFKAATAWLTWLAHCSSCRRCNAACRRRGGALQMCRTGFALHREWQQAWSDLSTNAPKAKA